MAGLGRLDGVCVGAQHHDGSACGSCERPPDLTRRHRSRLLPLLPVPLEHIGKLRLNAIEEVSKVPGHPHDICVGIRLRHKDEQ